MSLGALDIFYRLAGSQQVMQSISHRHPLLPKTFPSTKFRVYDEIYS